MTNTIARSHVGLRQLRCVKSVKHRADFNDSGCKRRMQSISSAVLLPIDSMLKYLRNTGLN